jgi:hypothetical protein
MAKKKTNPAKFVALFDAHVGYELVNGHRRPLHDPQAISVAMQFIKDFTPDHVILGGDMLDCAAISHHNKDKAGKTEGLRVLADAKELIRTVIDPLEQSVKGRLVYHTGNHEKWLDDLIEKQPGLAGIVDIKSVLKLTSRWEVIPQGQPSKLDKMVFVHGDQLKGGQHPAKAAVEAYQRNVFFGHFHTHATYTTVSALDLYGHSGTAVPCLCRKNPSYGGGSPNRWMQGFVFGYTTPTQFNAYVATIVNGRAIINGGEYKG